MRRRFSRNGASAHALAAIALSFGAAACGAPYDEEPVDGPEPVDVIEEGATPATVGQAVSSSCSTSSVKGLSLQIIQEGNCIVPGAYAEVPDLPNIHFTSVVWPYLEAPARDKLVAALEANPNKTMTVNSMLRTVAQQYLLRRWSELGKCGIGLAAKPGNSNHETGLALDISEYSSWRTALQNRGFKWLGSQDPVHFDYAGAGAVDHRGVDVEAFQRLWNRNNANDQIDEDGVWGSQTAARMKAAPAGGFPKGAVCDAEE